MQLEELKRKVQFNKKKQQALLEDIASLVHDGVNIKEAISTLETISSGILKLVASSITDALAQGKSFSAGLEPWLPGAIIEIIRCGENSGTLTESLRAAATALKKQNATVTKFITLVSYPAVVLTLSLVMLVVIKKTVLTNFVSIKPLSQWPAQGLSLYHLAELIEYWWWALAITISLLGFVIYKLLTTYTGEKRHQLDQLPILGLYRNAIAARFMQTLGLLINNGILVKKALSIIAMDAKPYLTWHLLHMEYRLSGGIDNIAEALDTSLLKQEDLVRLKVIAKGKGFAHALQSLAEQAHQRNTQTTHLIIRIVSAGLLITAALIAANIIFGVYSIGATLAR